MEELTLDGELYFSTKRAAKITGYAKDYVGQLCREGRVQARLVGRNWYVLDSSIREHRFGESESTEETAPAAEEILQNSPLPEWNSPQYSSEPVSEMSVVALEPVSEEVIEVKGVVEVDDSTLISEMQSAWQDWFKRNDSQKVLEETLLETPEVIDARDEAIQEKESVEGSVEVEEPAQIEEELEEEAVPVSINRSYVAPEPLKEDYVPVSTPAQASGWGSQDSYIQPTRHYRRAKPATKAVATDRGIVKMALQIFFVLIVVSVVAITVIGSGYADTLFKRDYSKYSPLQYLGGERVIEKY